MMEIRNRLRGNKFSPKEVRPHVADERWDNPICVGHMTKQGSGFKSWKRRYFILTGDGQLWYFKSRIQSEPLKTPLCVREARYLENKDKKKPFCIRVDCRFRKPFYFHADKKAVFEKWCQKLFEAGGKFSYNFFGRNIKKSRDFAFPYIMITLMDVIRQEIQKKPYHKIFTKAGNKQRVIEIRAAMIETEADLGYLMTHDMYDLCSLLIHFVKENPEAMFSHCFDEIMKANASRPPSTRKVKIYDVIDTSLRCYPLLYGFCREMFNLLHCLGVKYANHTQHNVKTMSKIFVPFFLRPGGSMTCPTDLVFEVKRLMAEMIKNHEYYFDNGERSKGKGRSKGEDDSSSEEGEEDSSSDEGEEESSSEEEEEEEGESSEEEEVMSSEDEEFEEVPEKITQEMYMKLKKELAITKRKLRKAERELQKYKKKGGK